MFNSCVGMWLTGFALRHGPCRGVVCLQFPLTGEPSAPEHVSALFRLPPLWAVPSASRLSHSLQFDTHPTVVYMYF